MIYGFNMFLTNLPWFFLGWYTLKGSRRVGKTVICIVCLAFPILRGLGGYFFASMNAENWLELDGYFLLVLTIAIIMGFYACFRISFVKLLYLGLLLYTLATLANHTASGIIRTLWPDLAGIDITVKTWQFSFIIPIILLVIVPFTYHFLVKKLRKAFEVIENKNMWLLCTAPILFFVLMTIVNTIMWSDGYTASTVYIVGVFIMLTGVFVYYTNIQMVLTTAEVIKTKKDFAVQEQLYAIQCDLTRQLIHNAETIKTMRHDMRHHLSVITGMDASGEREKLTAYLETLAGRLPSIDGKVYCENPAVNAIVFHFLSQAENEGIAVDVSIKIPEDTGHVSAMDLCVIMGNLLENALEACRRMQHGERYITVRSAVNGNRLSIGVSNSFDGNWNVLDGVYLSRKHDKGKLREGMGISSVVAVCEKYDGRIEIEAEANVWKVSALVYV